MAPDDRRFETDRTRRFRAGTLSAVDDGTIGDIERCGVSIVSVVSSGYGLGWSYTIGVFDTGGGPELIAVGLSPETAQYLLGEAAERLRAGVDLSHGRHRGLIGEVECEFRSVDPKWVSHLMNWARWYYAGDDFPVLQAVYPDLENRFPEDERFDSRFEQPLMQPGAPMTRPERDFWASTDPKSSMFNWKFEDAPHTLVVVSVAVNGGCEPVTLVWHDADDGSWQFVGDGTTGRVGFVLVCFHHPIDQDPSLTELADLPRGWYAERARVCDPWVRMQADEVEE
jgi:hypothetical protein